MKYRFLKAFIKLIGFKKYFNESEGEMIAKARKNMDKIKIPVLSHSEINYEIKKFNGASLHIKTRGKLRAFLVINALSINMCNYFNYERGRLWH